VDPRILELCRKKPSFAYEVYEFVCEAVTFTQEKLGRQAESREDPEPEAHVSGAELLRGVCDLAIREFGMMAPVVFRQWGIRTTDDVGAMVFNLIQVQRLSKSDRDAPDDFRDLFDLHQTLIDGFSLKVGDGQPAKRGER
jgi:uncharacterized repeat protein (TIGR04138 family)